MFQCFICKKYDDSEPFLIRYCGTQYALCSSCADLVVAFGFDPYEM